MTASSRRSARGRNKAPPDSEVEHSYVLRRKVSERLSKDGRKFNSLQLKDVNLKLLAGLAVLGVVAIALVIYYHGGSGVTEVERLRVITPLPAPKMMDLPQFKGEHEEALYWGTYRPHVYLGIRARTPRSLIAGLMWIGVQNGQYRVRHVCQDSDDLSSYGWTHHNGRDYGRQVLVDQGMTLITSFLKAKMNGSAYGGDWAVRIDAQNNRSGMDEETWGAAHLFFYLADEVENALSINSGGIFQQDHTLLASGSHKDIGGWEFYLNSAEKLEISFSGFRSAHMHNLTDLFLQSLGSHVCSRVFVSLVHTHPPFLRQI